MYLNIFIHRNGKKKKKKAKLNYPMPAKTYKKGISHPLLLGVETDPTCQKFNLAT